jgi:hypothetical protein
MGYAVDMWCIWLACSESAVVPIETDAPSPVPVEDRPSRLVINEVMGDNDSTAAGPLVGFADWVELYNGDDVPHDLGQLRLEGKNGFWQGDFGTIEAHGRWMIWADANFSVDKDGDDLTLQLDGVEVDRVATGALPGDVSFARIPDAGAWAPTWRATPGGPNPTQAGSADPSDFLFGDDRIVRIDLTIRGEELQKLRDNPRVDAKASLGVGAAYFPEVGVRVKGFWGSTRSIDQKAALKINLDAYADVRLRGLESLTLNNCVQDPTYVHESLAYDLFRALDVPAPRTGWVWLVVNGEDWGLYSHLESEDENFLARWYGNAGGHLYESSYPYDLHPGSEGFYGYNEGPDPNDREGLRQLIAALAEPPTDAAVARLERILDLDEVLRELAGEALTTHWDGYKDNLNNYRLYLDPYTGRFQLLPWGVDQTFLGSAWPWNAAGRIAQFCFANAGCLARYDAALADALDVYDRLNLIDRLDERSARLRPLVEADPRREFDLATHDIYVDYTRYMIESYPASVRYWLND